MSRASRQSLVLGVGLAAVVGLAYLAGTSLRPTECNSLVGGACLAGVTLAIVAVVRGNRRKPAPPIEQIAGLGLLAYIVLAVLSEQFAWASNERGVIIGIAWLIPPAAGGVLLPRRDCWYAATGYWAVLFAGTAALSYTASHVYSGMGLIIMWMY